LPGQIVDQWFDYLRNFFRDKNAAFITIKNRGRKSSLEVAVVRDNPTMWLRFYLSFESPHPDLSEIATY